MRYQKAIENFERFFFWSALARHKWNIPAAAREIGMTRQGLYKIISKYRLKSGTRPRDPATFLAIERKRLKPVRRVVLLDPLDLAWMKSKAHVASYSQIIRAGLQLLKGKSESAIKALL